MFKCICNTGAHDLKSDLCYFSRMAKSGGNHSKAPKGPINTHISMQSQRSNCSLAPPLSPGLPVGPSAISFSCVSTGFRGAVVSYVHNLLTIAHKRKLWWPQRSTTLIGAHTKLTTRPLACHSPQPPRCGGARALFTTCIVPCTVQCNAPCIVQCISCLQHITGMVVA